MNGSLSSNHGRAVFCLPRSKRAKPSRWFENVRFWPTRPLPLPRPLGKSLLREFNNRRADSMAVHEATTTRARARCMRPSESKYKTPVASPFGPTSIS